MKKLVLSILSASLLCSFAFAEAQKKPAPAQKPQPTLRAKAQKKNLSWARFERYEALNSRLKQAPTAVFMGDSITEGWARQRPEFFEQNNYLGRGISGQTSCQMLVRFRPDVIDLKPKAVVILAGTNDVAENIGPIKLDYVLANIKSMAELGRLHGIRVILCSVMPSCEFPWHKGLEPAEKIKKLNAMIKDFADKNGFEYVDYYSALVDSRGGLPEKYSRDGVHLKNEGYAVIEPIIKAKLNEK